MNALWSAIWDFYHSPFGATVSMLALLLMVCFALSPSIEERQRSSFRKFFIFLATLWLFALMLYPVGYITMVVFEHIARTQLGSPDFHGLIYMGVATAIITLSALGLSYVLMRVFLRWLDQLPPAT